MMFTAHETIDQLRPIAVVLVDREERHTRSRMTAYQRIASRVGVSSSWLQKLIGRRPVSVALHEGMNLLMAYRRLCERIEAEADHERKTMLALKENKHHAAIEMALSPLVLPQADQGHDTPPVSPSLAQSQRR